MNALLNNSVVGSKPSSFTFDRAYAMLTGVRKVTCERECFPTRMSCGAIMENARWVPLPMTATLGIR